MQSDTDQSQSGQAHLDAQAERSSPDKAIKGAWRAVSALRLPDVTWSFKGRGSGKKYQADLPAIYETWYAGQNQAQKKVDTATHPYGNADPC